MSGRVVYYYERALTATVANIEHIESQSLYGAGIVKIYFQPGTDIAAAQAQVTSALSLNGAYTFTEGAYNSANGSGNPHWHQGTLQGDYSLSKRTDVYLEGVYQHVSAPVGSVFSGAVINGLSPSTSNSQVAATVGIRHRF
jgi:predicted porin